ncbi:MMPL family transporter [Vibrio hannami]|uniref:MMPL family transporter n=1 Tax=Vibrio hannami TaxID=2717094 RepID=UPI00240F5DC2|nr:MMPL family transporter [Vibrio hannami]MDG3087538.1 MMPL family transporter [Vibrio hannami]
MKNWLSSSDGSRALSRLWLVAFLIFSALLLRNTLWQEKPFIETDVLALLPENRQDPVAQEAFDKIADSVSNKVIFVLSDSDKASLYDSAEWFSSQLSALAIFEQVTAQIPEATQKEWAKFYFENRFQLLTEEQRSTLKSDPKVQTAHVVQSIYNPFLGVTGAELSVDPFLLHRDYIAYLSSLAGKFKADDGYLVQNAQGEWHLLIVAELKSSPYNFTAQEQVPYLNQLEHDLTDKFGVSAIHTGALFYASFGTDSAKSEISTIGLGSLVGVLVLFLTIYRSALPLTLALVSISAGFICALSVSLLIFDKVHLFSLVFGASLIGVSIDYSFHYLTERLVAGREWNAGEALKHVFGAITLGLITSLIGYLGLLVAPFPGLQQLSVFSSVGLISSYLTVVCWYPVLARKPSGTGKLPGEGLWTKWLALWASKKFRFGFPLTIAVVSLILLGKTTYNDDIRQLQAMPDALKQQEAKIQQLTGLSSSQQMLLVAGSDEQALLQELETLSQQLDRFKGDGLLESYQSIHQYLPSIKRQQENHSYIESLYQAEGANLEVALGLSKTDFQVKPFSPVNLNDFLSSPVSDAISFLWLGEVQKQQYALISLNKVSNSQKIKDWAETIDQVTYLNKADEISQLFGEYRSNVTLLLVVAVVSICLILGWRYGFTQSLLMVLPPVIAGFAAIAVSSITGVPVNLFNLLALVLILGIGIDYTLFFTEQIQSKTTLLAITLSAITTILSFGLLALSNTNAIHSFGITILTGIFVSWLLSPLALTRTDK